MSVSSRAKKLNNDTVAEHVRQHEGVISAKCSIDVKKMSKNPTYPFFYMTRSDILTTLWSRMQEPDIDQDERPKIHIYIRQYPLWMLYVEGYEPLILFFNLNFIICFLGGCGHPSRPKCIVCLLKTGWQAPQFKDVGEHVQFLLASTPFNNNEDRVIYTHLQLNKDKAEHLLKLTAVFSNVSHVLHWDGDANIRLCVVASGCFFQFIVAEEILSATELRVALKVQSSACLDGDLLWYKEDVALVLYDVAIAGRVRALVPTSEQSAPNKHVLELGDQWSR
ncbi:hypothetical protein FB451DRAFT_1172012 [Mycena latifolia]|nr:hypothetical protein FB451DRAFT_1172012 [Mycena latifolia]